MHKFSDTEIDFILGDIKANGVVLEDLQYNLLDHICCIIEEEKSDSDDFYEFYERILPRFFKSSLKEIQDETDLLIRFKNYYAMKKTLKITGITAAVLTLLGATLKILHLPGAGINLVLGGALFSAIFLPLMIILKFKDEVQPIDKVVLSIGFLLGIVTTSGVLFKLMHWPGANMMMNYGLALFVFGYVPLYFITRIRREELRFNTTVNSVLMMGCGGMLFALVNLGVSNNANLGMNDSLVFLEGSSKQLTFENSQLVASVDNNEQITLLHQESVKLIELIDAIQWNLIAQSEHTSVDVVKSRGKLELKNPHNGYVVQNFNKGDGEYSFANLKKAIDQYNDLQAFLFKSEEQSILSIDNLSLDDTVVSKVVFSLGQIKQQVAINEQKGIAIAMK